MLDETPSPVGLPVEVAVVSDPDPPDPPDPAPAVCG